MSTDSLDQLINKFEPITLKEMDRVKLMNRVDTKFTFTQDELIKMLPKLIEHYQLLEIEGTRLPSYESLYYDDQELSLYTDHHRKKLNRYKVRFRKYVESDITFLEVKHKNRGRTDKKRIQVDRIHEIMSSDHERFVESTGLELNGLKPMLLNKFERMTLVGKNYNERLTLDVNLRFSKDGEDEQLDNLVIAELKQEKVSRTSPFFKIMKENMIRPYRISKYCIGVIKLYGKENVKYNRFKKKLLKLKKIKNDAA